MATLTVQGQINNVGGRSGRREEDVRGATGVNGPASCPSP
jgi:hypothetical protein